MKKGLKFPNDPESEFYIEKFTGREGVFFDASTSSQGVISYHLLFDNKEIGIFHENELEYVTP